MRVVLSTYDSRGGVEPLVALAVRLHELGAQVQVCAPPDCAERLAEVGVPLMPVGKPVRPLVHGTVRPSPADIPRLAAEVMGAQFDALAATAEGADAIVTSGLVPAVAGARSVAEMLGIPSMMVHWCPIFLPSPHHRPQPLPGRPIPADVTDPGELDAVDVANYNAFIGEPLNTQLLRHGNRQAEPASLERARRVKRLIFDVEIAEPNLCSKAARMGQRRPTLTQRQSVSRILNWQYFPVAPER